MSKSLKTWMIICIFLIICLNANLLQSQDAKERETVKMRIVIQNSSKKEPKSIPIKIYLPPELKREDIISTGGLELKHDSKESVYYVVSKNKIKLHRTASFFIYTTQTKEGTSLRYSL